MQPEAQARCQEFVAKPIEIEFSPQVWESQQESRRQKADPSIGRREAESVKPIVIQNLHMTNNLQLSLANSTEAKSTVESNVLGSLEGIARLVKEKID